MNDSRERKFRVIKGVHRDNSAEFDSERAFASVSGSERGAVGLGANNKSSRFRFRSNSKVSDRANRGDLGYRALDDELKAQQAIRATSQLSFALIILVVFLVLVGAAMVLSTSFVPSLGVNGTGSPFAIFERQLVWIIAGMASFFIIARLNPKRLAPIARLFLIPVILLLLLVLVPGIGVSVGGSSRWVGVSIFRFQPSEAAKFAVVLYLAGFFTPAVPERIQTIRAAFPAIWLVGLAAFLVLLEPDMGTALVVGTILLGVLFLAGMRIRVYAPFVITTVTVAVYAALLKPYRRERLLSFMHPWQNRLAYSYQEVQGMVAFATGGTTGVGLGAGAAKWGYLPNSQTDFIYAILGQEAGMIGCLVVLFALGLLCVVVMKIGLRAGSRFEFLLCAGVSIWIGSQSLFNIGAVLGVFPVTGVPLPLISAGGSSLMILLLSLGLVLGVAKRPGQLYLTEKSTGQSSKR